MDPAQRRGSHMGRAGQATLFKLTSSSGIDARVGRNVAYSAEGDTLDDLMRGAVDHILTGGERHEASRGAFLEIVGASLELRNPRARLSRTEQRRRATSAIAELCWYLSGTNASEPIVFYLPRYADDAEDDGTIHGGYGPRLFGEDEGAQVQRVIDLLKEGPSSRRAVIQIYDRTDVASPVRFRDVPCTCTMQFLLRSGHLHLVVYMRSNDVYFGLTHDVFAFTMVQEIVARELEVEPGRYVHMVGSLHLYEDKVDDARGAVDRMRLALCRLSMKYAVCKCGTACFTSPENVTVTNLGSYVSRRC
jgi:thymidylate synthase